MKLVIGADSAGKPLLDVIAKHLAGKGVDVTDMSPPSGSAPEFYADTAERVGLAIKNHEFERGILFCGTGIGVCISANKVPGIRAALTHDTYSAERAAKSNNAQIITLGARVVGTGTRQGRGGHLARLRIRRERLLRPQRRRHREARRQIFAAGLSSQLRREAAQCRGGPRAVEGPPAISA